MTSSIQKPVTKRHPLFDIKMALELNFVHFGKYLDNTSTETIVLVEILSVTLH